MSRQPEIDPPKPLLLGCSNGAPSRTSAAEESAWKALSPRMIMRELTSAARHMDTKFTEERVDELQLEQMAAIAACVFDQFGLEVPDCRPRQGRSSRRVDVCSS
jgi:hypothetical protein